MNWHPRKTIELGGSSSQWVSEISASHFSGEDSPEFVLFHFQADRYEGELSSFDGRYLLNDEPLVIENLLKNYSTIYPNSNSFLLFSKKTVQDSIIKTSQPKKIIQFNQWVSVPNEETSFTTCKVNVQHSISQKALTFLYKDDNYLIDYKLKDGRVFTYRFLPNTVVDGLWCNPLITELQSKEIEGEVAEIRFRKLYYGDSKIKIQFVKNEIITTRNMFSIPFNKSAANNSKTVLSRKNNFETQTEEWFEPGNEGFESKQSNKINSEQFSFTHRLSLDSIWSQVDSGINSIQIQAQVLYKINGTQSDIVIEVKKSKDDFWKSTRLSQSEDWNYSYVPKTINRIDHGQGELLIYCWNKNKNPLLIDDFEITIVTQ